MKFLKNNKKFIAVNLIAVSISIFLFAVVGTFVDIEVNRLTIIALLFGRYVLPTIMNFANRRI